MGFLHIQQVRQCSTTRDSDFYNYQNLNSRRLNCGTLIDRITIWCAKWDTDVVHGVPIGITVGSGTNFFCKYSCGIKNLPINVVRGRKRPGYVRSLNGRTQRDLYREPVVLPILKLTMVRFRRVEIFTLLNVTVQRYVWHLRTTNSIFIATNTDSMLRELAVFILPPQQFSQPLVRFW